MRRGATRVRSVCMPHTFHSHTCIYILILNSHSYSCMLYLYYDWRRVVRTRFLFFFLKIFSNYEIQGGQLHTWRFTSATKNTFNYIGINRGERQCEAVKLRKNDSTLWAKIYMQKMYAGIVRFWFYTFLKRHACYWLLCFDHYYFDFIFTCIAYVPL